MIHSVLVACDFSTLSEAALEYGRSMARAFGARLHLLHVMDNDFLRPTAVDPQSLAAAAERQLTDKLTREDRDALYASVAIARAPDAAAEIVQYARNERIDLIVMGTHGRMGMAHFFLGSVAEHVVRSASCPVLTMRQPRKEV